MDQVYVMSFLFSLSYSVVCDETTGLFGLFNMNTARYNNKRHHNKSVSLLYA